MSFLNQSEDIEEENNQKIEHDKQNRQRLQRNQQRCILLGNIVTLVAFLVATVSPKWLRVSLQGKSYQIGLHII